MHSKVRNNGVFLTIIDRKPYIIWKELFQNKDYIKITYTMIIIACTTSTHYTLKSLKSFAVYQWLRLAS